MRTPLYYLKKYAQAQGLSIVTQHAKPLTEAITEDIDNEEGYVATWLNAAGPPLKVKIKYATYCRLHRMLTQTSPLTVWEALRDNLDLDKLSADSPAEFQTWVGSVIRDLRGKYAAIEQAALDAYLTYKPDPNLPEDVAAYKKHLLSMLNHNLPTLRICCSPCSLRKTLHLKSGSRSGRRSSTFSKPTLIHNLRRIRR